MTISKPSQAPSFATILAPPPAIELPEIPGRVRLWTLANGLDVCVLENHRAPLVTTVVCYRVGTRDERRGEGGIAHFLEHMMFKGSPGFGAGEIDRRTLALGGHNNAFTGHDATAYHFQFAAECWEEALLIEADRMGELLLEGHEVDNERQVILEEIAMYENEPWDALELDVLARLYGDHPYARSVLGNRSDLEGSGAAELRAFHRQHYGPDNAVLVVAGAVPPDVDGRIEDAFGGLSARGGSRPELPSALPGKTPQRVARSGGEIARLLVALPAPPAASSEHAALRVLGTLLSGGRSSRLHRRLVEERELALWVSAEVSETVGPGCLSFALEVIPGVDPQRVEAELLGELSRIAGSEPPSAEEVWTAKRQLAADWVFGHERIHQQAVATAVAVALFDSDHVRRSLAAALEADVDDVAAAARAHLDPSHGGVIGWSLPR